jgi:hypothetical protein
LNTFRETLNGLKGMTLGDLVKDAPALVEMFKALGVSLDTSNFKGAGEAISKELKDATKSANELRENLNSVES